MTSLTEQHNSAIRKERALAHIMAQNFAELGVDVSAEITAIRQLVESGQYDEAIGAVMALSQRIPNR